MKNVTLHSIVLPETFSAYLTRAELVDALIGEEHSQAGGGCAEKERQEESAHKLHTGKICQLSFSIVVVQIRRQARHCSTMNAPVESLRHLWKIREAPF